jgi:LacI family purine nucleotide synthesis repressor
VSDVAKRNTIKDVARRANVSIATVSKALNNVNVVKPETKARVIQAAKDLNYAPNLMGRQLRSGTTKMLGLFTDSVSGPYFYTLVEAISHEVARLGYGMHVVITHDHQALMDSVLGGIVDGTIIFEHTIDDHDIGQIKEHSIPTVLLDRVDSAEKMCSITFDSFKEGYEAGKYLLNLGHQRICYVAGLDNNYDSNMRKAGFQKAVEDAGLDPNTMPILQGMFEEEASYNAVKSYLNKTENLVTAFLASNDLGAIGTIKAIQNAGYQVPNDFSVIGFDDIDVAQYFRPPITTVRNPIARQGIMAVRLLINMVNGGDGGKEERLEGKLIIRESTSLPRKK